MSLYDKDSSGNYDVLHDNRNVYRMALIHSTNYKAEKAVLELGLKGVVPLSVDEVELIRVKYQKIVVLCDLAQEHKGMHVLGRLATVLAPGGRIIQLA